MGDLRPTSEVQGGEWSRGIYGMSKVERYGLAETILRLRKDGLRVHEIVKACNSELHARPDGKRYYTISWVNVQDFLDKYIKFRYKSFLEQHKEELEHYEDPLTLIHGFCQQIKLEMKYAQEHRAADGTAANHDKLMDIMGMLRDTLASMGTLYQKIAPAFNVVYFRRNLKALLTAISGRTDLNRDQKERTILNIRYCLLTDNFLQSLQHQAEDEDEE